MSYIHFCGAIGKCFSGPQNENNRWRECKEPERPTDIPEDETEATWLGCLRCALYLEGVRSANDQPYRFKPTGVFISGKTAAAFTVAVAGGGVSAYLLQSNRLFCGRMVRKGLGP